MQRIHTFVYHVSIRGFKQFHYKSSDGKVLGKCSLDIVAATNETRLWCSCTLVIMLWQSALLERIQREEERDEHENRHAGRYRRIFPPVDRLTRIRYANLLANAYRTFLSGRQSQSLDLEIQRLYSSDLKVLRLVLFCTTGVLIRVYIFATRHCRQKPCFRAVRMPRSFVRPDRSWCLMNGMSSLDETYWLTQVVLFSDPNKSPLNKNCLFNKLLFICFSVV